MPVETEDRTGEVHEENIGGAIPEAGPLGRWIDRGGIVFAIGITASMLILIQEVVLRYGFNSPTIWAHETTVFLCATAFVYGGQFSNSSN